MSKFKVGDKVKLVDNKANSHNEVGDVGIVTKVIHDKLTRTFEYKVQVEGNSTVSNWSFEGDLELVEKESSLKVSYTSKLEKKISVTYNNLSENDMRNFIHEAIDRLGVSSGRQIPEDMVKLREELIEVMFGI